VQVTSGTPSHRVSQVVVPPLKGKGSSEIAKTPVHFQSLKPNEFIIAKVPHETIVGQRA